MYVNNCASLVLCNKEANEIYLAYSVDKKKFCFFEWVVCYGQCCSDQNVNLSSPKGDLH